MGLITKIRSLSPYFLAVVATLFIAFMVIQDSSCDQLGQKPRLASEIVVAEINGEEIFLAEYEEKVREATEIRRQQDPKGEVDDASIRDQVWQNLVDEVLRRQEARKFGLGVTDEEIRDFIVRNPPDFLRENFKDSSGRFMAGRYFDLVTNPDMLADEYVNAGRPEAEGREAVSNWKKYLFMLEDNLRLTKLQEAITSTIGAAASSPSIAAAEHQYRNDNTSADIRFIALDWERVEPVTVEVTEDEQREYYERNKRFYEQRESRKIRYVSLDYVPSERDSARAMATSERLVRLFTSLTTPEQRDSAFQVESAALGSQQHGWVSVNDAPAPVSVALQSLPERDVFGPLNTPFGIKYYRLDGRREGENPTTRASHILIMFKSDKEAARKQATDLARRVRKGEDINALAMQFSEDPSAKQNSGDLGYFGQGRMVKEFEEAAFNAKIGEVVGPIETQYGFHVIKVTDKASTELQWTEITINPTLSQTSRQEIIIKADELKKKVEAGISFDSAAAKHGVLVTASEFFRRSTPILGSSELTRFAFENSKGAVTRLETRSGQLIIAQVEEVRSDGVKPFEDVQDQILLKLKQRKAVSMLEEKARKIAAQVKSAGSLEAALSVDGTLEIRVQTELKHSGLMQGYAQEFHATAAAMKQPVGTLGDPVRGNKAWFIIEVTSRRDADMSKFGDTRKQIMDGYASRQRSTAYYLWFQQVKEKSRVIDNRGKDI